MDVRCTWEVMLFCLGMADVGTCYIVDAWRHVRSFTIFTRYGKCRCPQHYRCPEACGVPYHMGVNGAHNTIGKRSAPTTLFGLYCAREGCKVLSGRCAGYGPYIVVLTCAPCLTFSGRFLVLTERASPVGWSQSALIVPVEEEQ